MINQPQESRQYTIHGLIVGGLIPGVLAGALALAAVVTAQQTPLPGANTLYRRPAWVSTKATLAYPPMGSLSFVVTSVALADQRLDLGAWHGFQEVMLRRPIIPGRMTFSLELDPKALFHVVFNRTSAGWCGLRLARSTEARAGFFCADPSGRLVRRQPLDRPPRITGRVIVELRFSNDQVRATVDGQALKPFRIQRAAGQQLGFRGGPERAVVDRVTITDQHGRQVIQEDFDPPTRTRRLALGSGLAALALALAIGWRHRRRRFVLWLVCLGLTLLLLLTWAGRLVLQKKAGAYPDNPDQVDWAGLTLPKKDWVSVKASIFQPVPATKPPGQLRLLLLGGSQAWGEGASSAERRYVDRLCAGLRQQRTFGDDLVCINAGLPGAELASLHDFNELAAHRINADITVMVLGINDREDSDRLRRGLEMFWGRHRERGGRLVLVAEPMYDNDPALLRNHRMLRRFARRHGVPFIEAHGHLQRQRHSGFLWWDRYHFSDLGHELMAQELIRTIGLHAPTLSVDKRPPKK